MLEIKKISDKEYHAIQGIDRNDLSLSVLSASLLKRIISQGALEVVYNEEVHNSKTLELFRVGTLIHLYILERSLFDIKYYIGEYDPLENRERVDTELGEMLLKVGEDVLKKYPFILNEEGNEVSIMGEYDGLNVKSKIDKLVIEDGKIKVFDLKSIGIPLQSLKLDRYGQPFELKRVIQDYLYDVQLSFCGELSREYYIQNGHFLEVEYYLLFVSKVDFKSRLVRLSEETMGYATEKLRDAKDVAKEIISGNVVNDTIII